MKNSIRNYLIMTMLLFFTLTTYASVVQEIPPEGITAGYLLTMLAPVITLGITGLIRVVRPMIPAWATVLWVAGLSMAVAFVAEKMGALENSSLLVQFGWGLLSIVINQFYRAFTGGNAAHARVKK